MLRLASLIAAMSGIATPIMADPVAQSVSSAQPSWSSTFSLEPVREAAGLLFGSFIPQHLDVPRYFDRLPFASVGDDVHGLLARSTAAESGGMVGFERLPVVLLVGQITPSVGSLGGGADARGAAPGLGVAYQMTDDVLVSVAGSYSVNSDHRIPVHASSANTPSAPAVFMLTYTPSPSVYVRAFGGADLAGQFFLGEMNDRPAASPRPDVEPLAGVSLMFRF